MTKGWGIRKQSTIKGQKSDEPLII